MQPILSIAYLNLLPDDYAVENERNNEHVPGPINAINGLWLTAQQLLPLREKAIVMRDRGVILGQKILADYQAIPKSQLLKKIKQVALIVAVAVVIALIVGCFFFGIGALCSLLIPFLSPIFGVLAQILCALAAGLIGVGVGTAIVKGGFIGYLEELYWNFNRTIDVVANRPIEALLQNLQRWNKDAMFQFDHENFGQANVEQVKAVLPRLERLKELPLIDFILQRYAETVYERASDEQKRAFLMGMNDFFEERPDYLENPMWNIDELTLLVPQFIEEYDLLQLKNAAKSCLVEKKPGIGMAGVCADDVLSYMV